MVLYKKNSGEVTIFGNDVLSSTTQARLDATQSSCTMTIRDITDNADETNQTITLTYQSNGNYSFPMSSINSVMTAGNYYQGTISKAGMIDIEYYFGVVSATPEALNDQQKLDVNAEVVDVLKTDALTENGIGTPPATPTFQEALMYLYQALTSKAVSTATSTEIYKNDGTKVAEANITEASAQITRDKFLSA